MSHHGALLQLQDIKWGEEPWDSYNLSMLVLQRVKGYITKLLVVCFIHEWRQTNWIHTPAKLLRGWHIQYPLLKNILVFMIWLINCAKVTVANECFKIHYLSLLNAKSLMILVWIWRIFYIKTKQISSFCACNMFPSYFYPHLKLFSGFLW